jgi:hypothetical protein
MNSKKAKQLRKAARKEATEFEQIKTQVVYQDKSRSKQRLGTISYNENTVKRIYRDKKNAI